MKQNVMKRTLAGVLAVLTVAAYMPANVGGFLTESTGIVMGVSAEEATSVSTAGALKTAVEAGESVQLAANIDLTKTLNVTEDVTIDLNGHNITATDTRAFHVKSGTLTLTGNGTVSSMHTDDNTSFNSSSSVIRVGDGTSETGTNSIEAKLTINKDVTVSSNWCYGVSVFGTDTVETVNIYGKIIVNGEQSALSGLGTKYYGSTTINLYPGSVIKSQNDVAIYHPQAGNMNVDGSTIEGLGGIEAKSGTIEISGDTVVTATGKEIHDANGDGTSTKGYAIAAVKNDKGYQGGAHFIINGGTFTGKVAVAKDNDDPYFAEPIIGISGGTFNTDVSEYVAPGYVQQNGTVVAESASDYVISESGTITLTKDTTYGKITVAPGVKATLDLCGNNLNLTLTGDNRSFLVGEGAELTIKNTYIGTGGVITANSQSTVDKNAKLYISSGVTLTQNKAEYTIYYKAGSTVTVHGTVENRYEKGEAAISGNHNNSAGSTLNIMNGAVLTEKGNAIYHPQDGTLNITGGTVSGETAIYARTGNINISGGTVQGTKATYVAPDTYPNGADPTGDAIVCQSHESYGVPVLKITSGIIESESGKTVASYAYNQKTPAISITGGRFLNPTNYPEVDELDRSFIADGYAQYKYDFGSGSNVVKLSTLGEEYFITVTSIDVNGNKTSTKVYPDFYGADTYTIPKAFYLDGMIFTSWAFFDESGKFIDDKEYESDAQQLANELVSSGEDFTVKLQYSPDIHIYGGTLTVEGGTITSSPRTPAGYPTTDYISRNDLVKVSATDTAAFSYWKMTLNGVDTIVSYNPTYSFYMPDGDVSLVAVSNKDVEPKGTGNIESVKKVSENQMAFVSVLNVPDGCKMLKAGLVARKTYALNGAELTAANAKYVKYTDTSRNNYKTYKYTWTLGTNDYSAEWTVRPYLEYKDKEGKVQTIYGEPVAKSLEQL